MGQVAINNYVITEKGLNKDDIFERPFDTKHMPPKLSLIDKIKKIIKWKKSITPQN